MSPMLRSVSRAFSVVCLCFATTCGGQESETAAAPDASDATSTGTILLRGESVTSPSAVVHPAFSPDGEYAIRRARMVVSQIEDRGVRDPGTLRALRRVPRHKFVSEAQLSVAYADTPLPIGHGQTISQPYIVGYMTELLDLKPTDRVLEIGTGSGYQAAILAEIAPDVVTLEIIDELARSAAQRLRQLGYPNITVISGDGYFGWSPHAPYDAIIVTAAADHVPPPLVAQLKPGGRMAIPVGRTGWTQNLLLVEKQTDGTVTTRNLLPVRFVPLTRSAR